MNVTVARHSDQDIRRAVKRPDGNAAWRDSDRTAAAFVADVACDLILIEDAICDIAGIPHQARAAQRPGEYRAVAERFAAYIPAQGRQVLDIYQACEDAAAAWLADRIAGQLTTPGGWHPSDWQIVQRFTAADWAYVLDATCGADLSEPDEIASVASGFIDSRIQRILGG